MVLTRKRPVGFYIASIVVVGLQPGSARAQEKPESSLSAMFPVAGHAAVDPGGRQQVRTDPDTFSGDPRLGRQLVDNDADAGRVFVMTVVGTAVGYLGGWYFLTKICWDNCTPGNDNDFYLVAAAASAVGLPALGAQLGGGDGRWALLGSAVGLVGGGLVVNRVAGDDLAAWMLLVGIHVTATTAFALK